MGCCFIRNSRLHGHRGLSRLEVVAIILVLGLSCQLIAMSLPVVRERSRRVSCINHMRMQAMALLSYHDANQKLPPAAVWNADGVLDLKESFRSDGQQIQFFRKPRPVELTRENWLYFLLPQLGFQEVSDAWDTTVPLVHVRNEKVRLTALAPLSCPSDTWNRLDNRYQIEVNGSRVEFVRGNYGINGGSHYIYDAPGWLTNPRPDSLNYDYDREKGTFSFWGNGIAGINKSFSLNDMQNGLATLVLVNELRAGIHAIDPRGVWSQGQIGSSIVWGHGAASGDGYGPNNRFVHADDVRGCVDMHRILGKDYIASVNMECCDHCPENHQATSRSMHPGGVNAVMADGAVRFVRNEVDPGLWHAMHSRETPSEIAAEDFEARLEDTTALQVESTPAKYEHRSPTNKIINSIGMEFVEVPSGEFTMGLPNEGMKSPFPKEIVAHHVHITRPFQLGIHEVTESQYRQVMESPQSPMPESRKPVVNVSWNDAQSFCHKLSQLPAERESSRIYRLPTEAEWEHAARADRKKPIRFKRTWVDEPSGEIGGKEWKEFIPIEDVGSYPANPYGIHDMCGNVFEWTGDWYSFDYYRWSTTKDPQGPKVGYLKVVRGWYWNVIGPGCVRNVPTSPVVENPFIGFRVVCEPADAQ